MKTIKLFFAILISLLSLTSTIKADTLYIQLPGGTQNFCQDINNFDTFVFYKPIGFLGTQWNIDGTIYGYNDSLVFIPTSTGNYAIGASWNGIVEGVVLQLYSTPPTHANFSVTGGTLNTTKDTVWMCGTSLALASNTIGSEATYYSWNRIGGYQNTSDDPLTITIPGTYWFERGNACGIVRDTFVVVKLPNTLPSLGADTSFCNAAVSLTLNPGSGWQYDWSTGAKTQSITVSTAGVYTVSLTNACRTGSVSRTIHQETYPSPYVGRDTMTCFGQPIVLDPHAGYTYASYLWSDNSTSSTLDVTDNGLYRVTVTQGACSAISNTITINFQKPYQNTSICIATVDIVTAKNKVVWETKQDVGIESYNIYKLAGVYSLVGNVPITAASSLSYNDMTSNPMASAVRYKITAVDSCGNESNKSYGHGTIKINSNPGSGGVLDLTIVDKYWDESGSYSPSKYYVLIDSLNNGSLHVMDSIDAVFNSYSVINPLPGATYLMGIALPWACTNQVDILSWKSNNKSISVREMSISNKSATITTDIVELSTVSVSIYPNPSSSGIFQIEGEKISRVDVLDHLGRMVVSSTNEKIIDLSGYSAGVYYAKITTSQGSTSRLLVIQ